MGDNGKEKRKVSTFDDQLHILTSALDDGQKSRSKCLRKLFRSVTGDSRPSEAEAVQLTLGRNHEWRRQQTRVLKAVSKIVRIMMMTDKTMFLKMEWPELIELFITCGIFDVVNLLLRVQVPEDVAQSDASSILGDAWESVHLHSLELTSNILGSSYICPTEEKTRPFLNAVLSNKSFLDVVVKHAMESTRPMMISFALHILYHCATADVAAAKKIARKKELFLRLCEYVTKGNAVKMVTDWFRGGVEQYELDLLGDRPQGLLPIFHQEPFTQRAMDEMTKEEQRNAALTFADSLQLFSLRAMAMMCNVDTVGTDLVAKDPDLLTVSMRCYFYSSRVVF
ncbi:uncharacterized protein [Diadema antillarum]|uniref:uncharacterized protein n=1 Tax=Diadema antillarum TaxID=105358 RepID=UPI003A8B0A39